MKTSVKFVLALSTLPLANCASIITGTTQEMMISSTPGNAACDLNRNGETIASVTTPETITVKKTKHDINVVCNLNGYEQSTEFVNSGIEGWTFGNIILGGIIGWGIDSAVGADNKYLENVNVPMVPRRTGENKKSHELEKETAKGEPIS